MKGTIETPRIAKIVLSLIRDLFMNVILTLEKESTNQVVFSKQSAIKKCMNDVIDFIKEHPYAEFSIELLDSNTRDKENPLFSLVFRNYINEMENILPLKYYVILDETYTSFEAYQSSPGGILLKL